MLIKKGEIKEVDVKYHGKSCVAFEHGRTYKAVAYLPDEKLICVVDESNEDYVYSPEGFEVLGDITKLEHRR